MAPVADSDTAVYRAEVAALYRKFAPEKLQDIDALMAKYGGEFLAEMVQKKYGKYMAGYRCTECDPRKHLIEYSDMHPCYTEMGDVHIGDWDCDVCADTFEDVPFFACASFTDCVFKCCKSCLETCWVPEADDVEGPVEQSSIAAQPEQSDSTPAAGPLDLSKISQCRNCHQVLLLYNRDHPSFAEIDAIPEWDCDVCKQSKRDQDRLFACSTFTSCDFCACEGCIDSTTAKFPVGAMVPAAAPALEPAKSAAARWKLAGKAVQPTASMSLSSAITAVASGAIVAKRNCDKCGRGLTRFCQEHPQFDELGGWSDPDWTCDICEQEFQFGLEATVQCYVCIDFANCDWSCCTSCVQIASSKGEVVMSGLIKKSSAGKKDQFGNEVKSKKKVSWKNRWLVLSSCARPGAVDGEIDAMLRYYKSHRDFIAGKDALGEIRLVASETGAQLGPEPNGFIVTAPARDFICQVPTTDSTALTTAEKEAKKWVAAVTKTIDQTTAQAAAAELGEGGVPGARWPPTTFGAQQMYATSSQEQESGHCNVLAMRMRRSRQLPAIAWS